MKKWVDNLTSSPVNVVEVGGGVFVGAITSFAVETRLTGTTTPRVLHHHGPI